MNRLLARALLLPVLLAFASRAETIAEARALPAGTNVTIEGWVTVPPGLFSSATLEDEGFALQDATDGVYVGLASRLALPPNARVRVAGMVRDAFGLRFVSVASAADVTPLPAARRVAPEPAATGDVGEATEGRLLTITGRLTRPVAEDLPFGWELFLDDGSGEVKVFVHRSTGIDPTGIPWIRAGAGITVTGLSSRFLDIPEVDPRHRGDLRPAPPAF